MKHVWLFILCWMVPVYADQITLSSQMVTFMPTPQQEIVEGLSSVTVHVTGSTVGKKYLAVRIYLGPGGFYGTQDSRFQPAVKYYIANNGAFVNVFEHNEVSPRLAGKASFFQYESILEYDENTMPPIAFDEQIEVKFQIDMRNMPAQMYTGQVFFEIVSNADGNPFSPVTAISVPVQLQATVQPYTYLSVTPNQVSFGKLDPFKTPRVYAPTPLVVNWRSSILAPRAIRIYTENPEGVPGLVASDTYGDDVRPWIPLKVWCANYGPTGFTRFPPPPTVDIYWRGSPSHDYEDANWLSVPNLSGQRTVKAGLTDGRLLSFWADPGKTSSELGGRFEIYLGIDVSSVIVPKPTTVFRTNHLIIDMVHY